MIGHVRENPFGLCAEEFNEEIKCLGVSNVENSIKEGAVKAILGSFFHKKTVRMEKLGA